MASGHPIRGFSTLVVYISYMTDSPDTHAHKEGTDPEHTHDHGHGHDHHHHDVEHVSAALVTISSSRSFEEDAAGDTISELLTDGEHTIVTRELINDDFDGIQSAIHNLDAREDVDVIITTGGTGVTPDDVTVEAVSHFFEKKLPGFGERFRAKSVEEIGTRVIGTRATAGVTQTGTIIFVLPGSTNAVRLGVESLILPEVSHLVGLASRE